MLIIKCDGELFVLGFKECQILHNNITVALASSKW